MRRINSRGDLRGRVMRFLLRMAFWLTVILVLLPSGGSQPPPKVDVSAADAMSAAKRDRGRHAAILRAAARCLRGRIAGGGRARPPRAGRRQDALRIPQRASRAARHRRVDEDRGRQGGAAAAGAAIAAHAHAGRSGRRPGAARSRTARRAAIVPPEARSADLRSPTSHGFPIAGLGGPASGFILCRSRQSPRPIPAPIYRLCPTR